jgi:large subunit ribosomal protein L23
MEAFKVIIEPILTEKSNYLREQKKYLFKIDMRANRAQVMQAIKEIFSVTPVKCNIMRVKGKPKRQRFALGRTAQWKKAIVTLMPDDKIQIFEGS